MERVIASSRLRNDPISRQIMDQIGSRHTAMGLKDPILYYDFPLFRDYENAVYQPSLLLLDPQKGVVSIQVAHLNLNAAKDDAQLGELHSILFAKLLASRRLRRSRSSLKCELTSILFLPHQDNQAALETENIIVGSLEGLEQAIAAIDSEPLDAESLLECRSVIEGVKALTKQTPREVPEDGSLPKAALLRQLEDEIANFDASQRTAALTVPLGPQRIRGLAGSGKTIVLAWKAAHLHMQQPENKILVTFYTKSLYDLLRYQITRFYRHFKDADPNWDNLHVMHAWGGRQTPGVYYNACIDHQVAPKQWKEVAEVKDAFQFVCHDLLKRTRIQPKYDMVLIDEAQDFPPAFFDLAYQLTVGERDSKRLVWAYDELQSIFEAKIRSPAELFGFNENGEPRVDLDRAKAANGLGNYADNDLILKKCYRNPLPILVCSHALGLGIYGPQIVQMLQNKEHWEDVGYDIEEGGRKVGEKTVIVRPKKNSPSSMQDIESADEIVQWHCAKDFTSELDWIESQIAGFVKDGLRPEDIMVICLDDRNAKNYFKSLGQRLARRDIESHDLLANPFSTSRFVVENAVTLSTVHRAKGNEAPAVIVTGLDAIALERKSRRARNRIFTAFTRAKAWLRVSGVTGSEPLFEELRIALENCPRLIFTWPSLTQVETLQRDLSKKEELARRAREQYLRQLAKLGYSEEDALAEFSVEEKSE